MSEDTARLLQWVLGQPNARVSRVDPARWREDIPQVVAQRLLPDQVFEVHGSSARTAAFEELVAQYGSQYAFHGTSMENMHSVMHNGLTNHLTSVCEPLSNSASFRF